MHNPFLNFYLFGFLIFSCFSLSAQSLYGYRPFPQQLLNVDINLTGCGCSICDCEIETIGSTALLGNGMAINPDTLLFGHDLCLQTGTWGIWEIDKTTGSQTEYFIYPPGTPCMESLVAIGGDIFYSLSVIGSDLFEIDVTNGTITNLGSTGFSSDGEMTVFDNEIYYTSISPTPNSIVKV